MPNHVKRDLGGVFWAKQPQSRNDYGLKVEACKDAVVGLLDRRPLKTHVVFGIALLLYLGWS